MYGCESWIYKENWALKNWCFWTVVLEKTLESPWTARRSNQSNLKEISLGCSMEGLMLKLKLQYFGHLMQRADSFEKTLMLGKIEGRRSRDDRGWDGWMVSQTQWTWVWVDSRCGWWTGRPGVLRFMGWQRVRHDWTTELNWTDSSSKGREGSSFSYINAIFPAKHKKEQRGNMKFVSLRTKEQWLFIIHSRDNHWDVFVIPFLTVEEKV